MGGVGRDNVASTVEGSGWNWCCESEFFVFVMPFH